MGWFNNNDMKGSVGLSEVDVDILTHAGRKAVCIVNELGSDYFNAHAESFAISEKELRECKVVSLGKTQVLEHLRDLAERNLLYRLREHKKPYLYVITEEGFFFLRSNGITAEDLSRKDDGIAFAVHEPLKKEEEGDVDGIEGGDAMTEEEAREALAGWVNEHHGKD